MSAATSLRQSLLQRGLPEGRAEAVADALLAMDFQSLDDLVGAARFVY